MSARKVIVNIFWDLSKAKAIYSGFLGPKWKHLSAKHSEYNKLEHIEKSRTSQCIFLKVFIHNLRRLLGQQLIILKLIKGKLKYFSYCFYRSVSESNQTDKK